MNEPLSDPTHEVEVLTADVRLPGIITWPRNEAGMVAFAHGSGSSRFSSRNRFVADVLHEAGLGTLLFDLLTQREHVIDEQTRELRFDIELLAGRLVGAVDWLRAQPQLAGVPIGLFGASTGAAAALIAAARRPDAVKAVVSRGGRPDLAGEALPRVQAPTLLIVGERDVQVITLNREAADQLRCEKHIEIVANASHLFEEPGTLNEAARIARGWFEQHLSRVKQRARY